MRLKCLSTCVNILGVKYSPNLDLSDTFQMALVIKVIEKDSPARGREVLAPRNKRLDFYLADPSFFYNQHLKLNNRVSSLCVFFSLMLIQTYLLLIIYT